MPIMGLMINTKKMNLDQNKTDRMDLFKEFGPQARIWPTNLFAHLPAFCMYALQLFFTQFL